MKESLTGYLERGLEAGKLENLIYTQQGSLYYLPTFGIDRDFYMQSPFPIQVESFTSYLRQVALYNGIVTASINTTVKNNTANVRYVIASEQEQAGFNIIGINSNVEQ